MCSSCICASEMPNSGFPQRGLATIFVNRVDLGCYLLWDKAFNRVPSKGLAKETPLAVIVCTFQWPLSAPLSRADVQWVVLVRVPL